MSVEHPEPSTVLNQALSEPSLEVDRQDAYLNPETSEEFYDEILRSVGFNVTQCEESVMWRFGSIPMVSWLMIGNAMVDNQP